MIKRLRIKFVCVVMAIALVLVGGLLGVVIFFTRENMEMQSLSMMRTMASRPAPQGNIEKPRGKEGPMDFFTVEVGPGGEIVFLDGSPEDTDAENLQKTVQAALDSGREWGKLHKQGVRFLKVASPMGMRIVFSDLRGEKAMEETMLWTCLGIFAGAMAVFLVISLWLSRWMVRPVENAWEQQRQFVADASHELKTPLSVIMANAELLQGEDTEAEEQRELSGNILTMSYQMRSLVNSLLEMARVDNGRLQMDFAPVDLSRLVEDAVLSVQLLYQEQGLSLKSTVAEGVFINGSEKHLFQVLDVLLDNALKYSTPQGCVQVTLKQNGRGCLLTVSNDGEEIPKEQLQSIFKRFYRGDKARAINGSYGLGLSIAQSVVEAHSGKIWAETQPGRNLFCVHLPGHTKPTTENTPE